MTHADIRQTAAEAERHWWTTRLQALVETFRSEAVDIEDDGDFCCALTRRSDAGAIDALIQERSK
jgi:hypothetical protein